MPGKKGMKHYSREIKLEAIRLDHEEGKTRAEIAEMLGIQDPIRVKVWHTWSCGDLQLLFAHTMHFGLYDNRSFLRCWLVFYP
jgi:transposase-like protein